LPDLNALAAREARYVLRDATRENHRRVDAAFAAFDLSDRSDYARALVAHARALPALERAVDPASAWSGWSPRASLLAADLAELDLPQPALVGGFSANGPAASWGVQYVLEGSKIGGRMLARRVGVGLPQRYLAAGAEAGGWLQFQGELGLAARASGDQWLRKAVAAAKAAFGLFEAAIALEPEPAR
jgi:heme oxygenase (biliverdin-IX-beta and delta-forming)